MSDSVSRHFAAVSLAGAPARVTRAPVRRYHSPEMTDAMLVRAVLEGDGSAFAMLADRHARVCLRFATRMLGSPQDAEDVAQETFLRAYRALAQFDQQTSFRTWLMSILVNRCRTALLARSRRTARVVLDEQAVSDAAVESTAPNTDLRDAIDRALSQLDAGQREAFLLKHVELLSYDEMAAATGLGVSALKMRVQRACEHLKVLLEEDRHA